MTVKTGGARVLVIEDDEAINRSLVGSLGDAGYAVRGLPDGRELEGELDRFRPDLVFLDWIRRGPCA
ncbi:MAG TPA: response regulator [Friedmanniella sp.]